MKGVGSGCVFIEGWSWNREPDAEIEIEKESVVEIYQTERGKLADQKPQNSMDQT